MEANESTSPIGREPTRYDVIVGEFSMIPPIPREPSSTTADDRAKRALTSFKKHKSLLVESLQSEESFGSTLRMLYDMQNFSFNRYPSIDNNTVSELRTTANNFIDDNFQSIAAKFDEVTTPINRNLTLALITKSLYHGESAPRIDFMLDHFREALEMEKSRRELVRKGHPKLGYEIDLSELSISVFQKGYDPQKLRFINELASSINDPSVSQEVSRMVIYLRTSPMLGKKDREMIGEQVVKPFLSSYQLDADVLQEAWSGEDENLNFTLNVEAIIRLETKRPGLSKILMERYGIKHFGRYSEEMLIDMFDKRDDTETPFGVLVMPDDDPSGAFYEAMNPFHRFYEQMSEFGYVTRVYEVGNKYRLAKALVDSKRRSSEKISFVLLAGHGLPSSIRLVKRNGDTDQEEPELDTNGSRALLQQADFQGEGVKKMGELLADNCNVVLVSCSTGAENGIAQTIAETYPGTKVIAPNLPTNLKDILVTRDDQSKLHFKVLYRHPEVDRTFSMN